MLGVCFCPSLKLQTSRMLEEVVAYNIPVLTRTSWLPSSSGDSLFTMFKIQSVSWQVDPGQG